MAETLLFLGAILVAFEIVGDIGYIATLFSMPFALPLQPLMKRVGLSFKRVSPVRLGFQLNYPNGKTKHNALAQIGWWILLILSATIFSIASLVTQPIMIAYVVICRPLLAINRLLNFVYRKTTSQWDILYLVVMQNNINIMHHFKIQTTKKRYSDKELLDIRKKKGEIPFIAFMGVICIVAGFILQLKK